MIRTLDNMKLSILAAAIVLSMASYWLAKRFVLTRLQLPLRAPKDLVEVPVLAVLAVLAVLVLLKLLKLLN